MSRGPVNYCRGCEVRDEAERLCLGARITPVGSCLTSRAVSVFRSLQHDDGGAFVTSRLARSNQSADAVYGVLLFLYHNL